MCICSTNPDIFRVVSLSIDLQFWPKTNCYGYGMISFDFYHLFSSAYAIFKYEMSNIHINHQYCRIAKDTLWIKCTRAFMLACTRFIHLTSLICLNLYIYNNRDSLDFWHSHSNRKQNTNVKCKNFNMNIAYIQMRFAGILFLKLNEMTIKW